MRTLSTLMLATLLALSGCQASAPVASPTSSRPLSELRPGDPPVEGPGFRLEAEVPQAALTLTIHWPQRDVQAIPLSANTAMVWLYDSAGRQMAIQTVARPASGTLSSQVFFKVKAAMGVRVVAKLYKEATPTGSSTPLAMGTGTMNLYANNLNILSLVLAPVVSPAIAVLSPAYGGVGKTIEIDGANFGETDNLAIAVRFSGVPVASADIERVSDQVINVAVPDGAVNGLLELAIDGIRVSSGFRVLTALALDSFSLPLQAYRAVPLSATGTFSDRSSETVEAIDWVSSNPAVADVTSDGLLRPIAPGTTTLSASSGTVSAQATVRVTTQGAVVVAAVHMPVSSQASVSVPLVMPTAAPGNLPIGVVP